MSYVDFINSVPNIENKLYLEIGTFRAETFSEVKSKFKYGVDQQWADVYTKNDVHPVYPYPGQFRLSTDEFFHVIRQDFKFDVIFIDAGHAYANVLKDFNNSVSRLKENGYLFVHDLVPYNKESSSGNDGYRLLHFIMKNKLMPTYVANDHFGTTFFPKPYQVYPPFNYNISYEHFIEFLRSNEITYSEEQMCEIVKKAMES